MRNSVGPVLGIVSAVAATLAGVSASWAGFLSESYTPAELGIYLACVGSILGVAGAVTGYAFQSSRKSAKSVALYLSSEPSDR